MPAQAALSLHTKLLFNNVQNEQIILDFFSNCNQISVNFFFILMSVISDATHRFHFLPMLARPINCYVVIHRKD